MLSVAEYFTNRFVVSFRWCVVITRRVHNIISHRETYLCAEEENWPDQIPDQQTETESLSSQNKVFCIAEPETHNKYLCAPSAAAS